MEAKTSVTDDSRKSISPVRNRSTLAAKAALTHPHFQKQGSRDSLLFLLYADGVELSNE